MWSGDEKHLHRSCSVEERGDASTGRKLKGLSGCLLDGVMPGCDWNLGLTASCFL